MIKNRMKFFIAVVSLIVIGIFIGYGLTSHSDNDLILRAEPKELNSQSQSEVDLLNFNEAFISVAERANPSVVTIFTERVIERNSQEFRSHRI